AFSARGPAGKLRPCEQIATGLWQPSSATLRYDHRHVIATPAEIAVEGAGDHGRMPSGETRICTEIPVRRQSVGEHHQHGLRPERVAELVDAAGNVSRRAVVRDHPVARS